MKKFLSFFLSVFVVCQPCLSAALITPDTYDKLFLRMNGTTTTFVDSSTANPKAISANGNAVQLPIKFNRSAGFFNGTTDYVLVPDSEDWNFGTGAITLEGFFNFSEAAGADSLIECGNISADGVGIIKDATALYGYFNNAPTVSAAWVPTVNTWYHIALVRSGTNVNLYVNGVSISSGSSSAKVTSGTNGVRLGVRVAAANYFSGWMKEIRISNVARTVSVPTAQYESDANTVLLMHFDTPATSPLGPAIAFDGTGDWLTCEHSDDFAWGTNNTLEFFINPSSVAADLGFFVQYNAVPANTDLNGFYWDTVNGFTFFNREGGTNTILLKWAYTPIVNKWIHVALVKDGNDYEVFVDGRSLGTQTDTSTIADLTGRFSCFVARDEAYALATFNGFGREFRWSNSSRYTASFTPSQSGFTVDANTKLYIKGNEDNGVTTFVDQTGKTVTTVGDTKIKYTEDYRSCIFKDDGNTGHKPYPAGKAKVDFVAAFGEAVGYFDGNGDWLTVPQSADFDFGTADFTLEWYIRPVNNAATYYTLMNNEGTNTYYFILFPELTTFRIYNNSGSTDFTVPTMSYDQWHHVSVVLASGKVYLFFDGTLTNAGGTTKAGNWNGNATGSVFIPGNYVAPFQGLMDNVRVAKGISRYISSFNPPEDYPDAAWAGYIPVSIG